MELYSSPYSCELQWPATSGIFKTIIRRFLCEFSVSGSVRGVCDRGKHVGLPSILAGQDNNVRATRACSLPEHARWPRGACLLRGPRCFILLQALVTYKNFGFISGLVPQALL